MRIRKTTGHGDEEKIELQMTPMIDIVFQLLIFFVMTFKIAAPEGDFNIKMPAAAKEGEPDPLKPLPLKVTMKANAQGELTSLKVGEQEFAEDPFGRLRQRVIEYVGTATGPGSPAEEGEVELDCDYQLKYQYVVKAMDAVSGKITDDGTVARLMQKIKFTPVKKPAG